MKPQIPMTNHTRVARDWCLGIGHLLVIGAWALVISSRSHLNPHHLSLKHEVAADDALDARREPPVALGDLLGQQVEAHAGLDHLAELAIVHATEADEPVPAE